MPEDVTNTEFVNLTNVGQGPLLISSINWSGPSDFIETNNCPISPNSLAAGAFCSLTVSYTPTIVGSESGTITVLSNATGAQPLYISGSSVSAGNPALSPTSLTFPTTLIGQSSSAQNITLTNAGTGALGVSGVYSYGDFPVTNNCPASLPVNGSCTISVTYAPSTVGVENGSISVYTDSGISTYANVSGTGQAPLPTITSLSLTTVAAGSGDTPVTITGTGFVWNVTQVEINGDVLNYCCVWVNGSTQLTFSIPSSNLSQAGTLEISVSNSGPGGGTSNSLPVTVYTPFNYAFQSTSYNYRIFTGTNLNLGYFSAAQITSPFPIQFGGGSFTALTIGAGGEITFNGNSFEFPSPIPTSQFPAIIAPFWDQLYPFGTGNDNNVFWDVIGTAPNRQLVVEWRDVGICCETTNTVRFEVVFFEGNSYVLFNYQDAVFGGSYSSHDNGANASIGVQVTPILGTQSSYYQASVANKTAQLWYPSSPTATLSTSAVSFGYHQVGTLALAQVVTLTNGALVPLNVSSITIDNPDFTEANNCGTTLGSHKSCTIKLLFKPSQPTNETGTLTISDNATNSPQTVALSGTGTVTGVTVFPILVNFGSVAVNSTASAPVTLANGTNSPLTIQQITATPAVFTDSSNCGPSVAPGQACTVTVNFTPVQQGSVQGIVSMGLNGKAVKAVAQLVGSGK